MSVLPDGDASWATAPGFVQQRDSQAVASLGRQAGVLGHGGLQGFVQGVVVVQQGLLRGGEAPVSESLCLCSFSCVGAP